MNTLTAIQDITLPTKYNTKFNIVPPSNCIIADDLSLGDLNGEETFIFVLYCHWYGYDIGVANSIINEIALLFPDFIFAFKNMPDFESEIHSFHTSTKHIKNSPVIFLKKGSEERVLTERPSKVQLVNVLKALLS